MLGSMQNKGRQMRAYRRVSGLYRVQPLTHSLSAGLSSALVFVTSLTLYLLTLTHAHTFDALSYALAVDTKPWQELFHPHHLGYGPLGAGVLRVTQAMGWSGSAVLPMQVVNALAGATGVALFFGLIRVVTRRADLALVGALLLGGSYASWSYAVEVEVYTIATVFLIGCLWLIIRLLRAPGVGVCVALGVVQGLAVLFHQTNMLLCVPVGVALLLAEQRVRARLRLAFAYGIPLLVVVGGAYLLVGFGVSAFESWGEFVAWMTAYARTGWWGNAPSRATLGELAQGVTSALAHPAGGLLLLLLIGLVMLYLRHLMLRYRRLALCLAAWLITYGAFFAWWEPDNAEFWIASMPPAALLLVLALGASGPRWHAGVVLVLALGAVMVLGNYVAVVQRGSGAYTPQLARAQGLAAASLPGDLLVVPDGLQELSLHYYEGRTNAVSLGQFLAAHDGNMDVACERLQERIERALGRGVAVYIGNEVLQPELIDPRYGDPLVERFGLTGEEVRTCFAPYLSDLEPVETGPGLPVYYRLPSAREKLASGGWRFDDSRWGWQAGNARDERFEFYDTDDVWSFVPLADPYIESPFVAIDTDDYWALQVRVGKWVSNREAQVFFMDARGLITEERSLRWELANHADLKTYHLDLRDHPAWEGTVYGLRIDPSTGPDDDPDERVYVAWVRLLSYADDPPDPND